MNYSGKKVLVMGLGLHGGGLESARFLLKRGAEVTVTDLRDESTLMPSIEKLDAICRQIGRPPVRYVIGSHETEDFKNADIVIKNPGVRPDSPFLKAAKHIETDISLFLHENPARLFAVTGTKGKSTTSAALYWILSGGVEGKEIVSNNLNTINPSNTPFVRSTYLGGNITHSPLTFLDILTEKDNVVLELSSFQLGDLKGRTAADGSPLLKPAAAVLTAIMADHLDRYASMEEYIDDKRNIYRGQDSGCVTIAGDDSWGASFLAETKAKAVVFSDRQKPKNRLNGGWIEDGRGLAQLYGYKNISEEIAELVPAALLTPGKHQKINLLAAALAAYACGLNAENIRKALSAFRGIEHRLEFFHEADGIRFYNDSAATIPQAAAACIEALAAEAPLVLVTGGTDKNLDFSPLVKAAPQAVEIVLLAGTGSDKLAKLLTDNNISFNGPFDDLDMAVRCALNAAKPGCGIAYNIALSPGCASFGMFLNEFDRGRRWKEAVLTNSK